MFGYPPYYPYPPMSSQGTDPILEAERWVKKLKKAQKKATEAEAAKHKDKVSKPKNRWEKMDVAHMALGLFALFPIIGPLLGILYLDILIQFKHTLDLLLK
jgi:hypothetical protein